MSTNITVNENMIKYKGVFDFQQLFEKTYEWFIQHQYEVIENKYKHKVPTPKGAEEEIGWKASRKVNHYIQFHIDVTFKGWDIKEVEIVKDNEKKKLTFARLRILLSGAVEIDYNNQWKGPYKQKLWDWFTTFVIKKDIEILYADQLDYRVYKLQQVIKEVLDMQTKTNAFEGRW